MVGKGSAFAIGGCAFLVLFAVAAFIAMLAGGHAHANAGGLLFLFLIGGIIGLIVSFIYNKGRKDAIQAGRPNEPESLVKSATHVSCSPDRKINKTRNRLMVLGILAFPFVVMLGFVISQAIAPASSSPQPNQAAGTNTVYLPR